MPIAPRLPIPSGSAHSEFALVDTADAYDAWATGREGAEETCDGGLCISYCGKGTIPSVAINGPDGEVQLNGLAEIEVAAKALERALRLAEAFGPRIPYFDWMERQRGKSG